MICILPPLQWSPYSKSCDPLHLFPSASYRLAREAWMLLLRREPLPWRLPFPCKEPVPAPCPLCNDPLPRLSACDALSVGRGVVVGASAFRDRSRWILSRISCERHNSSDKNATFSVVSALKTLQYVSQYFQTSLNTFSQNLVLNGRRSQVAESLG